MSFKDNFTREERTDDLEFDYSAFWTYATTFLLLFLLPILYKLYNRIFYKCPILDTSRFKNCECSKCKEKMDNYCGKRKKEKFGLSFYIMIIIAAFLIYALSITYEEVINNEGKLKGFNPYDILEIPDDADDRKIKKAYKKMALTFHPDKCRTPDCKAKFIMITKAYEALTDEVAKENFKKYGNPDGAQNMKLSIALPPFIYNKKNHMPILVIFLALLLVVFPVGVYMWYTSTQQYGENGVRLENQPIYYRLLNENIQLKQMAFVIGSSIEFANLRISNDELEDLKKYFKLYKDNFPKADKRETSESNRKAIVLIYAVLDEKELPPYLQEEANKILEKVPDLITNIYQLAVEWTILYYQYGHVSSKVKKMGLNCLKTIIEFSQKIYQQLNNNSVPLNQIPHLNNNKIRELQR